MLLDHDSKEPGIEANWLPINTDIMHAQNPFPARSNQWQILNKNACMNRTHRRPAQ